MIVNRMFTWRFANAFFKANKSQSPIAKMKDKNEV